MAVRKNTTYNFAPDADLRLVKDRSLLGTSLVFQAETRVVVTQKTWDEIDVCLAKGDNKAAYGVLYRAAKGELGAPGTGHAIIQAAFGLLRPSQAVARAAQKKAKRPAGA